MDDLKTKGIKAFYWDLVGKFLMHGVNLVVSMFLARLLGPSDFGLIAIVMVFIGIASIFTDIGLGSALIQRKRLRPVHYTSVFYFNITIGLFLTVVIFFSAPWISYFYNNEQLILLIEVLSLSFIINSIGSVHIVILRKELKYALLTKISFISSFASGIIGISMAFYEAGIWSLVALILSRSTINTSLIWWTSQWYPMLLFSWRALIQLWGFGFRVFLANLLDTFFMRMDYLIIAKIFPIMTLGYFERAKSLNMMIVQFSSSSFTSVLFPVLSKVQHDLLRFQSIILKILGIISFITFLLLGFLYLVGEELIVVLYSDKWLPAADFFKLLVLSSFGYPISSLISNILNSRGNSKAMLRLEIYKKIITSANFFILYLFGINAFLYGLIVQKFLAAILNIFFASKETKVSISLFVKPVAMQMILASIATLLTLSFIRLFNMEELLFISLILKGSVFVFIYIYINHILKTSEYNNFLEHMKPLLNNIFQKIIVNLK